MRDTVEQTRELNRLMNMFRKEAKRHPTWNNMYGSDFFGVKENYIVYIHRVDPERNTYNIYKLSNDDYKMIMNMKISKMGYLEMNKFVKALVLFRLCRSILQSFELNTIHQ